MRRAGSGVVAGSIGARHHLQNRGGSRAMFRRRAASARVWFGCLAALRIRKSGEMGCQGRLHAGQLMGGQLQQGWHAQRCVLRAHVETGLHGLQTLQQACCFAPRNTGGQVPFLCRPQKLEGAVELHGKGEQHPVRLWRLHLPRTVRTGQLAQTYGHGSDQFQPLTEHEAAISSVGIEPHLTACLAVLFVILLPHSPGLH